MSHGMICFYFKPSSLIAWNLNRRISNLTNRPRGFGDLFAHAKHVIRVKKGLSCRVDFGPKVKGVCAGFSECARPTRFGRSEESEDWPSRCSYPVSVYYVCYDGRHKLINLPTVLNKNYRNSSITWVIVGKNMFYTQRTLLCIPYVFCPRNWVLVLLRPMSSIDPLTPAAHQTFEVVKLI